MNMRGAALVLVLWLLALLTATIGAFALSARIEYLQGRLSTDLGGGRQIAHAGIDYALSRMRATPTQPAWHADGRRYRWQFDGRTVDLRVIDETGKVDLNLADRHLLEELFHALEIEPTRATRVAGAILDWRDADDLRQPAGGAESADYIEAGYPHGAKNARFDSINELQRVLGMDAVLHAKVAPFVTVFGTPRPNSRHAAAPVLTAMGMDAALVLAQREQEQPGDGLEPMSSLPYATGSGTYSIESHVRMDNGHVVALRGVFRLTPLGATDTPYTVLRWEQGALER